MGRQGDGLQTIVVPKNLYSGPVKSWPRRESFSTSPEGDEPNDLVVGAEPEARVEPTRGERGAGGDESNQLVVSDPTRAGESNHYPLFFISPTASART